MQSDDRRQHHDAFSAPRVVVVVLLIFTFRSGILAIVEGNITIDKLAPRQAVPSDPITIP
jgi:hypothetical protein